MTHEKAPRAGSDTEIYPVLLTQIYSRASIGIFATVVNAAILALVIRNVVPRRSLVLWFSTVILYALIRFVIAINIKRDPVLVEDVHRSKRLLVIGIGITGTIWGATAVFLFPVQSIAHQAMIAFILGGMVAGAVGVFSSILPVFLAFSIPTLLPITIRLVLIGDEIHMAMAAMITLFGVLTFITAKYVNLETRELVSLKETFSRSLDARTEALRETNRQLETEVDRRKETEQALLGERDRLRKMIDEVRTLRGFIPICSSCKKIRDDAGYWQRIEKYIQERSDAKFSHSICPECSKKIYPELNGDS